MAAEDRGGGLGDTSSNGFDTFTLSVAPAAAPAGPPPAALAAAPP